MGGFFSVDPCQPGTDTSCEGWFSCMGANARILVAGYLGAIAVLFALSALFLATNKPPPPPGQGGKTLDKKLTFHSTDDAPRQFSQTGYKFSLVGSILLYSWSLLFLFGYIYSIMASVLVYAGRDSGTGESCEGYGILWWTCMPTFLNRFLMPCPADPDFGNMTGNWSWPSYMGPYCIIFTFCHLLWLALSLTWETLRVSFMTPMDSPSGDATHVLIDEVLDFDTDKDLRDPDLGCMGRVEGFFLGLMKPFQSAGQRTVVKIEVAADGTKSIEYTCVRYAYDDKEGRFRPKGIVQYTPMELHGLVEVGGRTRTEVRDQQAECGKNEIMVYVPGIFEALLSEFADFTYAFNSIGTWSYVVYSAWNIGIFWLLMTISSGAYRSLGIVRPNQQKTAELAQLTGMATVLRDNAWTSVQIRDIVLGDVIRVDGNSAKLPCDGIVVQGSLVVNESMLTGEPMPIQKMPVDKSANAQITKKNQAYSGTECMQSIGPSAGQALMIATSIGALTTRGQLVRMVLFPTSVKFRYNDQMPIVYGIIVIYMAILMAIYVSPLMDLGDWIGKYMMLLNTVAMCISPMLPVSLVMGQATAAKRLEKDHKIQCLQPGRIPIAGKMSTIVFDKTGTITKDGMDFDSVMPVADGGNLGAPIKIDPQNPEANPAMIERDVPTFLRYALAACHTVTTLPDGTFVGNAVEVAMVAAAGWKIYEDKVVSPSGLETLPLAKKLDFDHKRMTSGVVVSTGKELIVYIKGSYEKIQSISKPEAVPANYGSVTERCAKEGYYVLGICTKTMPLSEAGRLPDMTRDEIEEGLSVCGLLLFRNEMKWDSPDAILALKEGGIRSVICTGDNALTGISIGRQVHIVTSERVLLGELGATGLVEWRDPDDDTVKISDIWAGETAQANLALTQGAWRYFHRNPEELEQIWLRCTIFARMKPEDKINVVKYFQGRGLIVGMAGDGGNDCGGLRAAHAGLALSDAEASMVSPFSTGRDGKSLMTMVDLVREGRACLASNIGTFTYFMVYCFTLTTIRTLLGVISALSFGEFVWMLMDVGINIGLVGTMVTSGPTEKLGKYRPTATLLGPRTLAGIFYPYVACMFFFYIANNVILYGTDFYEISGGVFHPINDIGLSSHKWMLRGDNYVSPVAIVFLFFTLLTTAFVNTYGGEFRISILRNKGMMIFHGILVGLMLFLVWAPPNRLNCVFRVNCDTKESLAAGGLESDHPFNRGFWETLAFWSAGGLGDCFMGPNLKVWSGEWFSWYSVTTAYNATTGSPSEISPVGDLDAIPVRWVPVNAEDQGACYPDYLKDLTWRDYPNAGPLVMTASDSEDITGPRVPECEGPNNCYPFSFKLTLSLVVLAHVAFHHIYVKCILNGKFVENLRRKKEQENRKELELQQQRGARSPLVTV